MRPLLAPLALLAALAVPLFARPAADDTPPPKPVPALQRLFVTGASISAGFNLDPQANEIAGVTSRLQLAQVVEASLLAPHQPVGNAATTMFFTSPGPTAKRTVAEAKQAKATALVALDYLFWMGYGNGSEKARLARVDEGLKVLEGFSGRILLGDLPDFHGADTNPMFLPPQSIPGVETLAKLNERIAEFAKGHENVVVVPMADMMRRLIADEPFEVRGNKFEKGARARLMQGDNLHTTLEGTTALWILAVDAWLKADPELPAACFDLDVARVSKRAQEVLDKPAEKPAKGGKAKREKQPAGG